MRTTFLKEAGSRITLAALATLLAACVDQPPLAPVSDEWTTPQLTSLPQAAEAATTVATLRRVTARYHNLDAALADGFVFLHPCEERPGEGPVGTVYVNFERASDGVIDPELPDALVYAPSRNGRPKLAAVELVMPYDLWEEEEAPIFLGESFEEEDEFGVFGLHVWVWLNNPNGLLAESNPRVSCEA
jgi:hypothetical protein